MSIIVKRSTPRAIATRADRMLLKMGSLPSARVVRENEVWLYFATPRVAVDVRTRFIHSRISCEQYNRRVIVHLDAWEEFQSWEKQTAA